MASPRAATKHGPGMMVTGVVFSPDGSRIATSTLGGEVRLWDVAPAGPAGATPRRHEKRDGYVHLARLQSRREATLAGRRQRAMCASGTPPRVTPTATPSFMPAPWASVAFSPDGTMLATQSADATARIWDVKTWRAGQSAVATRGCGSSAMSFSPDGTLLATSSGFARDQVVGSPIRPTPLRATGTAEWVAGPWHSARTASCSRPAIRAGPRSCGTRQRGGLGANPYATRVA